MFFEYRRRDLNPHDRNDHRILSPACLPIPPLRHPWSEKRGSNPRPQPWQGCALPTELFSHYTIMLFLALFLFFYNSNALLPFPCQGWIFVSIPWGKVVLYQLSYFRITQLCYFSHYFFFYNSNALLNLHLFGNAMQMYNIFFYFPTIIRFISFNLFKASTGVRLFTSILTISSLI